jgi:hypothetical protein
MKTKIAVLTVVLLLVGALTAFAPRAKGVTKSEEWLIERLPNEIPGFTMVQGNGNPKVSYTMGQETYDKLKPMGIVARVFENTDRRIDTVAIVGESPDNFHDPTWCLPGQGWVLEPRKETVVETKTRGVVPISYFGAKGNGRQMIVAYTFKGPSAFTDSITKLTLDMWGKEFIQGRPQPGVFYRFLALDERTNLDDLKVFIANYLDKAGERGENVL